MGTPKAGRRALHEKLISFNNLFWWIRGESNSFPQDFILSLDIFESKAQVLQQKTFSQRK
ncbi:MAG: hypothetical protein IJU40_02655 [Desulfovibrionaceae bacterium]|nr:hypothetical protein [Desulfovibrionaceae bacterium]